MDKIIAKTSPLSSKETTKKKKRKRRPSPKTYVGGGAINKPKNKAQEDYNKALKKHAKNIKRNYGGTGQEKVS